MIFVDPKSTGFLFAVHLFVQQARLSPNNIIKLKCPVVCQKSRLFELISNCTCKALIAVQFEIISTQKFLSRPQKILSELLIYLYWTFVVGNTTMSSFLKMELMSTTFVANPPTAKDAHHNTFFYHIRF